MPWTGAGGHSRPLDAYGLAGHGLSRSAQREASVLERTPFFRFDDLIRRFSEDVKIKEYCPHNAKHISESVQKKKNRDEPDCHDVCFHLSLDAGAGKRQECVPKR